jgi:hypothetical protein
VYAYRPHLMNDEFAVMARTTLRAAGIETRDEDLPVVELVYESMRALFAALDTADLVRFPFDAIDPSRAP